MSNVPGEIIIAGTGTLYTAPEGTELPQYLSEPLDDAFVEHGYITEDGAKLTDDKSTNKVRAWQSFYPVRVHITERSGMLEFTLMQWNEENMILAYGGGGVFEPQPGEYRYSPPSPEELAIVAAVLDFADGDRNFRLSVARTFVTSSVESTFAKSGPALLPITLEILDAGSGLDPWNFDSDDPQWAPVAS